MRHFVVTGASGYIGRYVVASLTQAGGRVTAISRSRSTLPGSDNLTTVQSDLWDLENSTLEQIIPGATLIHLAWEDGFSHNSNKHMGSLSKHFDFISRCIDFGVERVVSLGTMHEIGPIQGLVSEGVACNPATQYGIAKNALRLAVSELCARRGISELWARCFYITGDDSENHSVFTRMLELEGAGEDSIALTLGTTQFDFIDVAELGELLAEVAQIESLTGTLNLGSGQVSTLREKIEEFAKAEGLKLTLEFGAYPEREGISTGCWPDLTRLRSEVAAVPPRERG